MMPGNLGTWTPQGQLRDFGLVLLKKMGYLAIAWAVLYFVSQFFNLNVILMLFAPMFGALVGLVFGWYVAENAVEQSGLTGLLLYVLLVVAATLPVVVVELVMMFFWPEIGFARWMCLTAIVVLAVAAAVWRASADE